MTKNKLLCAALLFLLLQAGISKAQPYIPQIMWSSSTSDASYGQTAAGDIDGDGKLELVFGCYRNDSSVYALNAEDGSLLWKKNTAAPGVEGCNDVAPVIYDVDGDGELEVILPSSCNPTTFCFNGMNGDIEWETPTRGSDSPPTIGDLDNDGLPEILHGEFGGYVICINAESGSVAWELPVDLNSWIQTAPTILDADGNGQLDFIVATWNSNSGDTNRIYAFRGDDHSPLWQYEVADVVYHGSAVADLDNDGKPEIVLGDYSGTLYCINADDHTLYWDYSYSPGYYNGSPAVIADLDGDQNCEVVFVSWFVVVALHSDGSVAWTQPLPGYDQSFRGVAVGDVDQDSDPDLVLGTTDGKLIALEGSSGLPLWSVDVAYLYGDTFEIDNAPILADFDGDGTLDIFFVGGHGEYPDFFNDYGMAYAFSTTAQQTGPSWLMFQHDICRQSSLCNDSLTEIKPLLPDQKKQGREGLSIFPNPVYGKTFALSLSGAKPGEEISVQLFDPTGREIYSTRVEADAEGNMLQKVISTDDFMMQSVPSGMIGVKASGGNGFDGTAKLLIIR
jgi:outer membrane protein assembly factor BamB